ncbi:MAG: DUF983 domain-containing protein [Alphaproteobacteria bacterium]|nr:DUF983 domain-containing protein [Alphaproteobacteria bacterium]
MTDAGVPLSSYGEESGAAPRTERDWRQALRRGFAMRCPHCNEGTLFRAYLKPVNECAVCGEEIHHHRADDAPPYVTIFIAGHLIAPLVVIVYDMNLGTPTWLDALVWCMIALVLCLWLLPRVKGALINYQWALRMHGFETAKIPPARTGGALSPPQPAKQDA